MSETVTVDTPMRVDEAMDVLGIRHFRWVMDMGAAYCASRATAALARGALDEARAYRTAERTVNRQAGMGG